MAQPVKCPSWRVQLPGGVRLAIGRARIALHGGSGSLGSAGLPMGTQQRTIRWPTARDQILLECGICSAGEQDLASPSPIGLDANRLFRPGRHAHVGASSSNGASNQVLLAKLRRSAGRVLQSAATACGARLSGTSGVRTNVHALTLRASREGTCPRNPGYFTLSVAPFPALQRLYDLELALLLAVVVAGALVPAVPVVPAPALALDRMVFAIA
jgi:hypothetical protein